MCFALQVPGMMRGCGGQTRANLDAGFDAPKDVVELSVSVCVFLCLCVCLPVCVCESLYFVRILIICCGACVRGTHLSLLSICLRLCVSVCLCGCV